MVRCAIAYTVKIVNKANVERAFIIKPTGLSANPLRSARLVLMWLASQLVVRVRPRRHALCTDVYGKTKVPHLRDSATTPMKFVIREALIAAKKKPIASVFLTEKN